MKKYVFVIALSFVFLFISGLCTVETTKTMDKVDSQYFELQGVKKLINDVPHTYEKESVENGLQDRTKLLMALPPESFSVESTQQDTSIKDSINSIISEKNQEYKIEKAKKEAKEKIQASSDRLGTAGRLYIPDVGVSVALYYGMDQGICDAWDSAAYFSFGAEDVIGDHNNQGFEAMKAAGIGTIAYIKTSSGLKTYVCVANLQGHNTEYDLTTSDGRSLKNMNSGGIAMYTCNENWRNITITLWQPE